MLNLKFCKHRLFYSTPLGGVGGGRTRARSATALQPRSGWVARGEVARRRGEKGRGVQGLRGKRARGWGGCSRWGPRSGRRERAQRTPATALGCLEGPTLPRDRRGGPAAPSPAAVPGLLAAGGGWWAGGQYRAQRDRSPWACPGALMAAVSPPMRGSTIAKLQFYRRDTSRR